MMHTSLLILYTVECALLLVTSMTLPPFVTATRRVPSGDHAISRTLLIVASVCQNKGGQMGTYTTITLRSVQFFLRGNVGDAKRHAPTASCYQSAIGENRTRPHLQTQSSASDQQQLQHIMIEIRTESVCNLVAARLTSFGASPSTALAAFPSDDHQPRNMADPAEKVGRFAARRRKKCLLQSLSRDRCI